MVHLAVMGVALEVAVVVVVVVVVGVVVVVVVVAVAAAAATTAAALTEGAVAHMAVTTQVACPFGIPAGKLALCYW